MPVVLIISKNTQLNELPCSRVDMILLHCKMASMHWHLSTWVWELRALGIYIGMMEYIVIILCGAIVQMENYGRIQTFLIQYTIHLSLVALSSCVGVIPQMVLVDVFFVILEKWKVLLAIFKLLKISIFPSAWLQISLLHYIFAKLLVYCLSQLYLESNYF